MIRVLHISRLQDYNITICAIQLNIDIYIVETRNIAYTLACYYIIMHKQQLVVHSIC